MLELNIDIYIHTLYLSHAMYRGISVFRQEKNYVAHIQKSTTE